LIHFSAPRFSRNTAASAVIQLSGMKKAMIAVAALYLAGSLAPWAFHDSRLPSTSETAPGRVAVASLNLAKFTDTGRIALELASIPALDKAGILLFQEVVNPPGDTPNIARQLAEQMNRHAVFRPAAPNVRDQGLAIVSRFPLRSDRVIPLKSYNLRYRSRTRFALAAVVDLPLAPLRVYNVHLDTRINSGERLEQLRPVLDDIANAAGPVVLGGDFNTNDWYWILRVLPFPLVRSQARALERDLREHGFTTPFTAAAPTFDHLGMHLDWIWVKGLAPVSSGVHPMRFSDHHAIVAAFSEPAAPPARPSRASSPPPNSSPAP
jgi:endonuclease/exonuclease/phosphatase (EEP) superfamily protein YafD